MDDDVSELSFGDLPDDVNEYGQAMNEHGQGVNEHNQLINPLNQLLNDDGQAVNENGHLINPLNQLINPAGQAVNENGHLIDAQDRLINNEGHLVNENDEPVDANGNLVNDEDCVLNSGRTRNWLTGYCRKPCPQAQHPTTGACVSQEWYDHPDRNWGDNLYFSYTPVGASLRDLSDQPFDKYEDSNYCKPGQKRNVNTGKCAKPPNCRKWQVLNPRTRRCVTREYLKRQELEPPHYLVEFENDDTQAEWHPTIEQSLATHNIEVEPDIISIRKMFQNDMFQGWDITVADMRTMLGVRLVAVEQLQNNVTVGIYSPEQRKYCEGSTFTKLLVSHFYACGFRHAKILNTQSPNFTTDLENVCKIASPSQWVFLENDYFCYEVLRYLMQLELEPRRFLKVVESGVFRIFIARSIPENADNAAAFYASLQQIFTDHNYHEGTPDNPVMNRQIAQLLDTAQASKGILSVGFSQFLQNPEPNPHNMGSNPNPYPGWVNADDAGDAGDAGVAGVAGDDDDDDDDL